jgi:hypothetical protein
MYMLFSAHTLLDNCTKNEHMDTLQWFVFFSYSNRQKNPTRKRARLYAIKTFCFDDKQVWKHSLSTAQFVSLKNIFLRTPTSTFSLRVRVSVSHETWENLIVPHRHIREESCPKSCYIYICGRRNWNSGKFKIFLGIFKIKFS